MSHHLLRMQITVAFAIRWMRLDPMQSTVLEFISRHHELGELQECAAAAIQVAWRYQRYATCRLCYDDAHNVCAPTYLPTDPCMRCGSLYCGDLPTCTPPGCTRSRLSGEKDPWAFHTEH